MKKLILLCLLIINQSFAQTKLKLIPYPQTVQLINSPIVSLSNGYYLSGDKAYNQYIKKYFGDKLKWNYAKTGTEIALKIVPLENVSDEAYKVTITAGKILIEGKNNAGLFYGIQTILQLGIQYGNQLPQLTISDSPRFGWRAYMLDEARYFKGKEVVLKLLDDMALLKLNVFHWHLTDDAGWRIEINKYPLLTKIGGVRDSSQINFEGKKWDSKKFDGVKHAGFYTQKEIKEIVAYAKERNITVVPEFNMPGHASAAVASYPFLGTSKEKIKVPAAFGVEKTVFDVSDPKVIKFFHDVLAEFASLFPSKVIHIGGDEVKFHQWEASESVKKYMVDNNLKEFSDLQVFFTNNISNYMDQKLNRRMMGWNEILGFKTHDYQTTGNATTELAKSAIIHFWNGTLENFNIAIKRGYQIVNSNHSDTYLDYTYNNISLKRAYDFEPVPKGMTAELSKNIIGLGCQMWSEWTPTFKEVTYQTFPRIAAYAEVGWSTASDKDYLSFQNRLTKLFDYWVSSGYHLPDRNSIK